MASAPLVSPAPSAHDLQTHLYAALLEGRTPDVSLRIRGSWCAIYKLHRVVLIQSGFFRSLFTSGFSESLPQSRQLGPDEIDIVFDDLNITRAAFEICIARLYGGGPQLYVPPYLIPSIAQPLSASFSEGLTWDKRPDDHHPASPRFLLSLLATAVFLSIPSIASQALSCVLSTIGPHTVIRYLNFALGHHIGEPEDFDLEAAIGLENIAQLTGHDGSESSDHALSDPDTVQREMADSHIPKENPEDGQNSMPTGDRAKPMLYYGAISDKIGEACACWLARWALDMLTVEELSEGVVPPPSSLQTGTARVKNLTSNISMGEGTRGPNSIPHIWRRGGLSAKWVSALVGADILFVNGESGRYTFACRVVELRRRGGIIEEEEFEWIGMFEHGIYYENMTMEDIINLSQDISPATQHSFVPLRVLQAALWRQAALRTRVTSRPPKSSPTSSRPVSSPPIEKELGIVVSTSDVRSTPPTEQQNSQVYFAVPDDSSLRLGDGGGLNETLPSTMDELYEQLHSPRVSPHLSSPNGAVPLRHGGRRFDIEIPVSESTFFGLLPRRYTRTTCVQSDPGGRQKWSLYAPCRFSVEFWDLDCLKEKSRLHSQTIWYAGSLFNVYVQAVRKKGQVQLGIYLHRQSSVDPVPGASIPSIVGSEMTGERSLSDGEGKGRAHSISSPMVTSMPRTPDNRPSMSSQLTREASSLPSSPTASGFSSLPVKQEVHALPATGSPVAPRQPYRDPRSSISAYFTINLTSATGTTHTRFSSTPDVFSISQSWGWKSNSLRTEEYLQVREENACPRATPYGSEVSLRATVVLGLV